MDSSTNETLAYWDKQRLNRRLIALLAEEPLTFLVNGRNRGWTLRTPGEETVHAAGFCLSEGLLDHPEQLISVDYDPKAPHQVAVALQEETGGKTGPATETPPSTARILAELKNAPVTEKPKVPIDIREGLARAEDLLSLQPLRQKTQASHAAAIYGENFQLLASAEDIGRHNALDKAIGKCFLKGRLPQAQALILSSRISIELVKKAARAGIPCIFALSRPSAMAVRIGRALSMCLCSLDSDRGLFVFCGNERLNV